MPTYESADTVALTAHIAVELQPLTPVVIHAEGAEDDGEVGPGPLVVYGDADTHWLPARSVANFEVLAHKLITWLSARASEETRGGIVLEREVRALPHLPLTDERCPMLNLVRELRKRGWAHVLHGVEHHADNALVKVYDGRLELRMKSYLMVCLQLAKCLALTSSIPSQEVVSFYRCLLNGLRVEPGEKNVVYAMLLNDHLGKKGKALLPLPDLDPAPIKDGDDDDGIMAALPDSVKPKKAAKSAGGHHGRRKPPLPPPPLPPPTEHGLPPPVVCPLPPEPGPAVDPPPDVRPVVGPVPIPKEDSDDDEVKGVPPDTQRGPGARRGRDDVIPWQPGIGEGVLVKYNPWVKPDGSVYYNWSLRCPVHRDVDCVKTRGVFPTSTARHGAIEPLALVHAWIPCPIRDKPGATHAQSNPTKAQIDAFVEAHREELEAIVARDVHGR